MRLRVLDHTRLARVCRTVEAWEGSSARAAVRLKIGAGTFSRWRQGKGGTHLNARSAHALFAYLPPDSVSEPAFRRWERDRARAILAPEASSALERYERWLGRELCRLAKAGGENLRPHGRWRDTWPRWADKLLRTVNEECPGEFAPLFKLEEQLAQRVTWTSSARFRLAYLRIVEPLLAARETGGFELGAEHLKTAERLRPYLRAAVKRECVLLTREPDLQRAQRTAGT